jgi:hypothetical protein
MNQKTLPYLCMAVIFAAMLLIPLSVTPASALCLKPQAEGQWVNTNPNTRSITRINVRFVCQDQIVNGTPYPPGPPYYLRLFGKCHPTDCHLGEHGAYQFGGNGIYAFIDHGFATRFVSVTEYSRDGLHVRIYTNFRDNRPDYTSDETFRRA